MSQNDALATLFRNLAAILEIKGGNPFKAIAFSKVSRILADLTVDLQKSCQDGTLKDIEGVGESSRKIIEEYCRTGRSTDYDEVAASVPAGLLPLLGIPGLGPKTIALLWKERQVASLEDLVKAIDGGGLAGLKGIGAKKIESIKQGIAMRGRSRAPHRSPGCDGDRPGAADAAAISASGGAGRVGRQPPQAPGDDWRCGPCLRAR